ncbi:hypothetical protein [Chryseobacterium sp. ON_d1]|uniref:hypothetical protein n=1 Tax=Chryseobacterium sp. ON_d1 TaxID=2583211 RepID=UPI00115A0A97|nr:hypothetical protein [Chryseobacterium sp. ON_d1]GEJ44028.1 hypothetical protein CRS_06360 [Chryseobacterium sp. ON_d1]
MKKTLIAALMVAIVPFNAQSKKRAVKYTFEKHFIEILKSPNVVPYEVSMFDSYFSLGKQYEKPTLLNEKPEVKYNEKIGVYTYVFKLDDVNYSLYLKENRIVEKMITVFDITHFVALMKKYNIENSEFVSGKGFKVNENYILVSKARFDQYDSFSFDIRGPEFFNLRDLLNSEK